MKYASLIGRIAAASERVARVAAKYSVVPAYLHSAEFARVVNENYRSKSELIRRLSLE